MVRFFCLRCWFNRRVLGAGGPKEEKVWVLFWWDGWMDFFALGGLLVVDGFGWELNDDGDGDEGVDRDQDDDRWLDSVGL